METMLLVPAVEFNPFPAVKDPETLGEEFNENVTVWLEADVEILVPSPDIVVAPETGVAVPVSAIKEAAVVPVAEIDM